MTSEQRVIGLVGLTAKAGKIVFGREACLEQIEKRKVKLLIIAGDSADRTKQDFSNICQRTNTKMIEFGTIETISKAIGQNNKAIIGVKDRNLALEILKILNGGDIIG